ncbi:MAG: HU family DNA-binding protein [Smithella sp.]
MNKIDVIMALAEKKNLTEKQATEIVNLIFKGFTNELKNGGRIEIRGFGSFSIRKYKSYKGRNPRTGKDVEVKPKRLPFFKVGRGLKKMVDNKKSESK